MWSTCGRMEKSGGYAMNKEKLRIQRRIVRNVEYMENVILWKIRNGK
jgi:hypothetical protein